MDFLELARIANDSNIQCNIRDVHYDSYAFVTDGEIVFERVDDEPKATTVLMLADMKCDKAVERISVLAGALGFEGRGTCKVAYDEPLYAYGEAGKFVDRHSWQLSCGHEGESRELPKFCPECGMKVVE